jgi:vancomycin resistance protein YoaR
MFLNDNPEKKKILKWLLISVAVFFVLSAASASAFWGFQKKYENKIFSGIRLGNLNLGGETKDEAKKIVGQKINEISQNGLKFEYNGQATIITPTISSFEADSSYQIITFNPDQTVEEIFSFGRSGNFLNNLKNRLSALIFKKNANILYIINEEEITKILKLNYGNLEIPAKSAELTATSSPSQNNEFTFSVNKEKLGKIINYGGAIKKLRENLKNLNNQPITLTSETDYPLIYKNECLNIEPEARKILSASPLTLTYQNKKWIIEKEKIADWLTLEKNDKKIIIVSLNSEKIANFLKETIAPQIEKEPIDARFEIKNGRVSEFQGGQDGLKIIEEETIKKIQESFITGNNNVIELTMKETKSAVSAGELNNFGIKEIIGTGHSNFSGSPVNRRHNIAVGASSINGLLIKPGEEFSMNKSLGEVDKESGYLPELVIKDGKTIPEYGGGLCQIGTTMFRTALASGMPITARQNHSYRVSYYEPAGTDATIYSPWPDFRFLNDTANYILIQTRIEGNNLYFDFWGTKDGRLVEKTDPIIYNITKPNPTKIIETLDLPAGEKKCTEKAHNGADAYFDYKVTYPISSATSTPVIKEKRFSSHYVPWQEVCLIGVEKLTEEKTEITPITEDQPSDTPPLATESAQLEIPIQ